MQGGCIFIFYMEGVLEYKVSFIIIVFLHVLCIFIFIDSVNNVCYLSLFLWVRVGELCNAQYISRQFLLLVTPF